MHPRNRWLGGANMMTVMGAFQAGEAQMELGGAEAQGRQNMVVADFQSTVGPDWFVVNDGVMGGLSRSDFQRTDEGKGRFSGFVSLENNGGFASVRAVMEEIDFEPFDGLELLVKGDGRIYDFRLRTDGRFDGMAYRLAFDTTAGEWQTIRLPFSAFEPTFRGWVPRNAPALDAGAVRQVGFLVGGKQKGPFSLEIQWIRAYNAPQES